MPCHCHYYHVDVIPSSQFYPRTLKRPQLPSALYQLWLGVLRGSKLLLVLTASSAQDCHRLWLSGAFCISDGRLGRGAQATARDQEGTRNL